MLHQVPKLRQTLRQRTIPPVQALVQNQVRVRKHLGVKHARARGTAAAAAAKEPLVVAEKRGQRAEGGRCVGVQLRGREVRPARRLEDLVGGGGV
jgi:hypothetical protein